MERKIKFEDVIKFIEKAMDSNCKIYIYCYKSSETSNSMAIYKEICKEESKRLSFSWTEKDNKFFINLSSEFFSEGRRSDYIIIVENKKDILKWETLIEEVIEYAHQKLETEFDNFFKEEYPTLKDINDLDDKED